MNQFDPLAILDKVNRMSEEESARDYAEWRALYGKLNPFAVGMFVERKGAPLSDEGRRLATLLSRAIHGRLPITQDIRFEMHHFLGAPLRSDVGIEQRRYDMALHRQKLVALLERYDRRIKQGRFGCLDCGKDTYKSGEYYMVEDEVWAASKIGPHDGMLCLRCLERRIGRELNGEEFTAKCPSLKAWTKHVAARLRCIRKGEREMNIALRNMPPPDIDEAEPPDDERSSVSALLLILPLEAWNEDDADHGDLVSVIMVGRGDHFMRRARDYEQRYAQAMAEWHEWDSGDEWGEAHDAKFNELNDKYDLGHAALCDETRFKIVEVTQPSLI